MPMPVIGIRSVLPPSSAEGAGAATRPAAVPSSKEAASAAAAPRPLLREGVDVVIVNFSKRCRRPGPRGDGREGTGLADGVELSRGRDGRTDVPRSSAGGRRFGRYVTRSPVRVG